MTELTHARGRRSRPQTVEGLQREIADKRGDLREDLDLLRDAVSIRLDPLAQLQAHPRIALAVGGIALGAALWMGIAFVRAMRATR